MSGIFNKIVAAYNSCLNDNCGANETQIFNQTSFEGMNALISGIKALETMYYETKESDGFNPNLEGSENIAFHKAKRALMGLGLIEPTDPIGANCKIIVNGKFLEQDEYFSFSSEGTVSLDDGVDAFGVDEEDIFHFCEGGEEELIILKEDNVGVDFKVISYVLVY